MPMVEVVGSREIMNVTGLSCPAGAITYFGGMVNLLPFRSFSASLNVGAAPGAAVQLDYGKYDANGNFYSSSQVLSTTTQYGNSARNDTVSSQGKFYINNTDTVAHTCSAVVNGWVN